MTQYRNTLLNESINTGDRDRAVATWLLVVCALVFGMVVLGGVTRLTGSGLSMVEWRPILGLLPPLSDAEWQRVFDIYRQTPEFQLVNSAMTVADFKGIFWLEYLHRVLGRVIGLAFGLPLVYFVIRGQIAPRELPLYLLMLALGGAQAVIGKFMVASGQVDVPQVSPYRLTAHLAAAFLVYGLMLWKALSLLRPTPGGQAHPAYRTTLWLAGLIGVTMVSGGFVAGLKAGKIYNTFPKMGEHWIPPGLGALDPVWRNLTENMTTVQFDHRLLALTTFALVVAYWFRSRHADLPGLARKASNALLHTTALQVVLGIATLMFAVPIVLGALHQAVALVLLTVTLTLLHSLRKVPA